MTKPTDFVPQSRALGSEERFVELATVPACSRGARRRKAGLSVLMLADDRHPANVVQDHIAAFTMYSRHRIRVINPIHEPVTSAGRAWRYDLILIHYSIFVLGEYFLPTPWCDFVCRFPGMKAQIIQDEYRYINAMKRRMAELGVHAVFSSLDRQNLERVYGGDLLASTRFYSCLPGYIAETFRAFNPPPISARPLDIVYRGRTILPHLGRLAQRKRIIGEQMAELARRYGLKADIASREESRIYGNAWTDFLMRGRATLGVEGGASIFDFEGEIEAAAQRYSSEHPAASFEQVWSAVLAPHEGNIVHQTLTPKLLEAIAAKTALILYPGKYRGILEPERHYIPLQPDASNAWEVVSRLRDTNYLQELVNRTFDEIMSREDLSKTFYIRQLDSVVAERFISTVRWPRDLTALARRFIASASFACSRP